MAFYKITKSPVTQTNVEIFKNGINIGLKRNIHDLGVEVDGWGGYVGQADQIAFAIAYDALGSVELALEKYQNILKAISAAAPFELEISIDAINNLLAQ